MITSLLKKALQYAAPCVDHAAKRNRVPSVTIPSVTIPSVTIRSVAVVAMAVVASLFTLHFVTAEDFQAAPMKLESGQLMIAPRPDSVVVVSKVWLILKSDDPNADPGEIKLNGEPVTWNPRFTGNVRVTDLWLDIGWQKMEVNGQKFRFAMGQNDLDHVGPKDWPVVRLHNMKPGPNPCAECHQCEKEDRKIQVGELKPPQDACFHCHEVPKTTEQHTNVKLEENWLESCRDCHYLHVSPYPYLLRKPKEGYMK